MSVALFDAYYILKCLSHDALHVSGICMHVTVHIDAIIIVARVLQNVNSWFLTELDDLSFLLHFVCASYEHELYMCFELNHAIFTEVQSMYFCESCSECIKLVK